MQKLIKDKRKLITIPLLTILVIMFFPFVIGISIGYLVFKKVNNPKIKYLLLSIIALFLLFFGSIWILAITSPNKQEIKQEQKAQITSTPQTKISPT